jgi:hypothetical protein
MIEKLGNLSDTILCPAFAKTLYWVGIIEQKSSQDVLESENLCKVELIDVKSIPKTFLFLNYI